MATFVVVIALASLSAATPANVNAEVSPRPLAVIVVGPLEARTSTVVREARTLAAQLRTYGANTREVYSPNATWSRVVQAAHGANLLVYIGAGRGHPSPYGSFDARTMNGLGLNRTAAGTHRNLRHYGEYYLRRSLRLASGAIVVLSRVPYSAGSSEPGRAAPTRATATRRADNYASGFLASGAAAVFATDHSVGSMVRDLFGSNRTMESLFWRSPWTSARYDSSFSSTRTRSARGVLAPYEPGRYFQSVVGRLTWTTASWRATWPPPGSLTTPGGGEGRSVKVGSVAALLGALADDGVSEIVVADGTYRVRGAGFQESNSLWIGNKFAARTRPVTVRAETVGGVIFDGGGSASFGGLSFEEGAHHQTWDGFTFANGLPYDTGVITFGGYAGRAAPHHITLRNITVAGSVTGRSTSAAARSTDHAVYVSHALDGPHDLLLEDLTVDGRNGLATAIVFYHSEGGNLNAWNVTVRRLRVLGTQQGVVLADRTLRNITVDGATISGVLAAAVNFEAAGATGILLSNNTTIDSGSGVGFYSSLGPSPAGVTFHNNSFD